MIRISAFADEISQDPDRTGRRPVPARHQVHRVPRDPRHERPRPVRRPARRVSRPAASRGFGLSAIGSPIGKIRITEPFDEHLERFERAMDLADFYEAPRIRIFSFYMPPGDDPAMHREAVLSRMAELARRAADRGITLVPREREGDLRRHRGPRRRHARDGRLAVA